MSLRHSSSENRSARWIVSTTPALATTASHPPSDSIAVGDPRPYSGPVADVERPRLAAAPATPSPARPAASQAATAQPP